MGEGNARPGPRSLDTGTLGSPGSPTGPVLGGRRRGPSLVREAPGVTGPKSPRSDERGRGLGCRGAGLAENTFWGGAKGRREARPVCLGGSTDSGHDPAVGGVSGWVREPRPRTFYLFLGRSQFALSGFFRHPGTGRGKGVPHQQDPGNPRGIASAATAPL